MQVLINVSRLETPRQAFETFLALDRVIVKVIENATPG
jgi:hypothetical protein